MSAELILGTAQLGSAYGINNTEGLLDQDRVFEVLDMAVQRGITTLDTAEGYGQSERLIGAYHQTHPDIKFKICTKLSGSIETESSNLSCLLDDRIHESCTALCCDSIFIYYLHAFEMCRDVHLLELLQEKKEQGLIGLLGVSIYEPGELSFILENRKTLVDVVQIPLNVFNYPQWAENDILDRAVDSGIMLLARSVYLQGLVFKNPCDPFVESIGLSDALSSFANLADNLGVTRAQLACDFVRGMENISYVILGSETSQQVDDNANMFVLDAVWTDSDRRKQECLGMGIDPVAVDPRKWTV